MATASFALLSFLLSSFYIPRFTFFISLPSFLPRTGTLRVVMPLRSSNLSLPATRLSSFTFKPRHAPWWCGPISRRSPLAHHLVARHVFSCCASSVFRFDSYKSTKAYTTLHRSFFRPFHSIPSCFRHAEDSQLRDWVATRDEWFLGDIFTLLGFLITLISREPTDDHRRRLSLPLKKSLWCTECRLAAAGSKILVLGLFQHEFSW